MTEKITPEGKFYIHIYGGVSGKSPAQKLEEIQNRLGDEWELVSVTTETAYANFESPQWISTWRRLGDKK